MSNNLSLLHFDIRSLYKNYNLEMSKSMNKHTNSQLPATFNNYLYSLQMFICMIPDKSKLNNLFYQKHVQTQVLK